MDWHSQHQQKRPLELANLIWWLNNNSSDNSLERTGIPSDRNSEENQTTPRVAGKYRFCIVYSTETCIQTEFWAPFSPPPTLSWLKKSSFDLKPLVPQSMSLNEPTSWAAYSPAPWCCSAFKHLATIWHLRRATGIQGMQGHAMLGRHHDHHGTLWCSKSFSRLQEWLDSLDGRCTMFDFLKSVTHLLELTWGCDIIWDCKAGLILPLTYF